MMEKIGTMEPTLEYWNGAKIIKGFKPNIPLFQHSSVPAWVPEFYLGEVSDPPPARVHFVKSIS
jgi:hypothetical protein